jgi:RNA polymerase sigma factor (sigma-70 family)
MQSPVTAGHGRLGWKKFRAGGEGALETPLYLSSQSCGWPFAEGFKPEMGAPSTQPAEPYDLSQYRPVLARFFRRRAHAADVDDLVQEVLLSVHARQTGAPIQNIEGYLFAVAAKALSKHRQRPGALSGWAEDELEGLSSEEACAERALIGRQNLAKAVEIITAGLPPRTREVFVLHRFEEMTYPAIAAALSISVSAVEKHIMIALKHLAAGLRQAP